MRADKSEENSYRDYGSPEAVLVTLCGLAGILCLDDLPACLVYLFAIRP